jgi:hypothetical protein
MKVFSIICKCLGTKREEWAAFVTFYARAFTNRGDKREKEEKREMKNPFFPPS